MSEAPLFKKLGDISLHQHVKEVVEHEVKMEDDLTTYEKETKQMQAVTKDILASLEKHQVNPMQAYMITGALSDAIYSMILEAALSDE